MDLPGTRSKTFHQGCGSRFGCLGRIRICILICIFVSGVKNVGCGSLISELFLYFECRVLFFLAGRMRINFTRIRITLFLAISVGAIFYFVFGLKKCQHLLKVLGVEKIILCGRKPPPWSLNLNLFSNKCLELIYLFQRKANYRYFIIVKTYSYFPRYKKN